MELVVAADDAPSYFGVRVEARPLLRQRRPVRGELQQGVVLNQAKPLRQRWDALAAAGPEAGDARPDDRAAGGGGGGRLAAGGELALREGGREYYRDEGGVRPPLAIDLGTVYGGQVSLISR